MNSWSGRWSIWRCVPCKNVVIARIWAWSLSMTRVVSARRSVRRSIRNTKWSWISFVFVISWLSALWRSSTFVINKSISRCRAISVLRIIFVEIIISGITSTSMTCIKSFCSVIWRRTKELHKRFLKDFDRA